MFVKIVNKLFYLFETSIIVFLVAHGLVFILLFTSQGGLSDAGSILFAFLIGIIFSLVKVPQRFPNKVKNPKLFTISLSIAFTTIVTFLLPIENISIQGVIILIGILWGWYGDKVIEKMSSDRE